MRKIVFYILLLPLLSQGQVVDRFTKFPSASGAVPVVQVSDSKTNSQDTNSTSIALDRPDNIAEDDLMLACVILDGPNPASAEWDATSDPTGWVFISDSYDTSSDSNIGLFYKIATASEASTYTFTTLSGSFDLSGSILRITGVNTSNPIGVEGTFNSGTSSSGSITGITTGNNNSIVIGIHAGDGSDTAPFSVSGTGWTEVLEIQSAATGNDGNSAVWASKDMTSTGATGNATITMNVSDGFGNIMLEIRSE